LTVENNSAEPVAMIRWRIPGIGTGSDVQGYGPVDGKGGIAGLVMVAIRQARKGPCRAEETWSRVAEHDLVPLSPSISNTKSYPIG
jgi:hypothetical protein